jgi:GNAT superfamily N-acetyltransferase
MPSTVLIRPATREDYAQWLPLWLGYNEFYGRSGATALPPAITEATWSRFFDVYEPMHCLVAEQLGDEERKLVGLVHFLYHQSTLAIAPYCYLHDLYADPAVRNQGIGRNLIQAVYERASQAGAARVYWLTHESNATARRLYDQVADLSGFLVYRMPIG